ncbi:von Willebrand factor D and EGF domain-containing protein-like [Ylistrum balloti]|uniref:von Willebrand factor D and EGF domain-containing protein-like n=1 Tax=Ylistrum balloti TaxID=509963 RepID=UPI0029058246|nr:von Willebrand factor D and EGF domain-containing protein-like [Ylistrum balloti]
MMIWYRYFLLGLMSSVFADIDPCMPGNHVLMDDPTRLTTYETDPTSVLCDDDLVTQWFRIKCGVLATTPPPLNRCGTEKPVWIDPTDMPSSGASAIVKTCMRTAFSDCRFKGEIHVTNCGGYYVYELKNVTKSYCPLRYCVEADSGVMVLPSVSVSLHDGTTTTNSGESFTKEILFTCDLGVNTEVDLTPIYYDVVWYINDQEIKRKTNLSNSAYISDGNLNESEWRGNYSLPMTVNCSVKAKAGVCPGTGYFVRSVSFFAGFTAELSGETLQENGELQLTIQLTVPLGCTFANVQGNDEYMRDFCRMRIKVIQPDQASATSQCTRAGVKNTNYNIRTNKAECGVTIFHTSWDTPVVLNISGAPDNIIKSGYRWGVIQLQTDQQFFHEVWSKVEGEKIEFYIHDDDIDIMGKSCYSSNDPHMKTFDGRHYELHETGEYVLYKHDNLSVAIHAYFQPCDWGKRNAKCNCGIAIRNSNAVFRANFCKHASGYNRIIEFIGCDNDAMTIEGFQSKQRFGSGYKIILPTGTMVTFTYGSYGSSVMLIHFIYVKPSLLDWKESRGLCGYMDGATANDFKKRDESEVQDVDDFSNSWKIVYESSESMFINPLEIQPPASSTMVREYCTCPDEYTFNDQMGASCSASPVELCSSSNTTINGYLHTCRTSLTKRDTEEEMVYFPWYTNLDDGDDTSLDSDWSGNWTENSAAEACRKYLRANPLIQKCEEVVPGFDSEDYVPDCTQDIKFMGSTLFMESTLSLLQTACVAEAVRLENLTRDDSGSGTTLLDEILALSCTNNCSNAGSCISGTCLCETSYEGDDCSLHGSDTPFLSQETNMGLCNSYLDTCSTYVITGEYFMRAQLTCRASSFKVNGSSLEMVGEILTFPGVYVNPFIGICEIPNNLISRKRRSDDQMPTTRKRRSISDGQLPTGYNISLSNDGTTFSTEVTFISFDANCYECNITTMTCTEKVV